MTIAFAGHALVPFGDKIKAQVIEQIRKHIVHTENITFYFGGYGDFDMICARVCNELKKEYDGIEVIYVTPYIRLSEQKKSRKCRKTVGAIHPYIRRSRAFRSSLLLRKEMNG